MKKDSPLKLAIIGLGHAAQYQLQALKSTNFFTLSAACDVDPNKQKILGSVLKNVPFFRDYKEIFKEVDVDIFLVSTPYFTHYRIAQEILKEKKNLLLEKPATSTLEELEDLIAIARTKNVVFSIALHAAYGKELIWFIENYKTNLIHKLDVITGFSCSFYDPYIVGDRILEIADSLGTSWLDSGINALSVIGRLLDNLKVVDTQFTYMPKSELRDVRAIVNFSFTGDCSNRGFIETNWTLGKNQKITNLYFSHSGNQIILNHSIQQVLIINNGDSTKVLADFSQGQSRLTNHYIGILEAYYKNLQNQSDNLDFALPLHKLVYSTLSCRK